jgi:hypothetical protein
LDAWARLTVDCCGLVRAMERGRAWLVTVAKKRFFAELNQKGYTNRTRVCTVVVGVVGAAVLGCRAQRREISVKIQLKG